MKWTLALVAAAGVASMASADVYQNRASIAIPGAGATTGPADPYPSVINIAGYSGPVTDVRVSLFLVGHTDLAVWQLGPLAT